MHNVVQLTFFEGGSVKQVKAAATTWTAGTNTRFNGMTLGEVKTLMGALPESEEMKADPRYKLCLPV